MSAEGKRAANLLRTLALVHERACDVSTHVAEHHATMQGLRIAALAIERGVHDHPMFDDEANLAGIDIDALLHGGHRG
jgi:hypothetical protein